MAYRNPGRLLAATLALVGACASSEETPPGLDNMFNPANGDGSAAGDGNGAGDGNAGADGTGTGDGDGSGDGGGTTTIGEDGCPETSVTAPPAANPKVDIVWVVDASGSMLDENRKVSANLAKFAEDVTAASVDIRIVMVTKSPAIPVICPPYPDDPMADTPLAGDPRYRYVRSDVDSTNLLEQALEQYPNYQDFLRPDASLNFMFLTDDESSYAGLGSAQERADRFLADMQQRAGKPIVAHTISSPGPNPCNDPMCSPDATTGICVFVMLGCGASGVGETYYTLADATGGLTSSICESDWSKIFGPLTEAVIESAPLPCDYAVPAPPDGTALDKDKVNVKYLASGAADQEVLPRTEELAACGNENAWYYQFDASGKPERVVLCPAACEHVSLGGTLNIAFGCDTITVF